MGSRVGQLMSQAHGNKKYLQVLIDPNRAVLLEEYAESKGIKASAAMRELLYDQLALEFPHKYPQALANDQKIRDQSIANRVAGRQKARARRHAEKTTPPEFNP